VSILEREDTSMQEGEKPITKSSVLAHAFETFGAEVKTNHWLNRPNHLFGGKTPREMIEIDLQAVEIELGRIDHGIYV
jgi:uncharacterized protein (DUF2384 family)